ncbi:MAG: helix-hairpin-helix domain-containing protein [Lachnospiraceae bacterium]|nr:helix-hairpin-helix domain-containing protein [Lachnospiraceae bacterium]
MIFCFSGCGEDEEIVISNGETAEDAQKEEQSPPTEEEAEDAEDPDKAESCFVYLVGAVKKPGVYEVPSGTRIFKVIDSAGGFREDAAAEALNLAAAVTDGSVIRVPDRQEYEESLGSQEPVSGAQEVMSGTAGAFDGKGLININTASLSELTELNGIGESRAQAIISYREENGAFGSVDEIKNVTGIKDGLFNKIKDQITV